ncbi:unnamed protein product [Amoebophrya sp. A25]|nr:unnamed protein product [Amoebophrya sp. A25]|eukprot:GSA25T00012949001.1
MDSTMSSCSSSFLFAFETDLRDQIVSTTQEETGADGCKIGASPTFQRKTERKIEANQRMWRRVQEELRVKALLYERLLTSNAISVVEREHSGVQEAESECDRMWDIILKSQQWRYNGMGQDDANRLEDGGPDNILTGAPGNSLPAIIASATSTTGRTRNASNGRAQPVVKPLVQTAAAAGGTGIGTSTSSSSYGTTTAARNSNTNYAGSSASSATASWSTRTTNTSAVGGRNITTVGGGGAGTTTTSSKNSMNLSSASILASSSILGKNATGKKSFNTALSGTGYDPSRNLNLVAPRLHRGGKTGGLQPDPENDMKSTGALLAGGPSGQSSGAASSVVSKIRHATSDIHSFLSAQMASLSDQQNSITLKMNKVDEPPF